MNSDPEELKNTLMETGSVSIGDRLRIDKQHVKYNLIAETELNDYKSRILQAKEIPDTSDFQTYIQAVETVNQWDENGYSDVGEWSHTLIRDKRHDWRTPEGNYVRLSTKRALSFSTSSVGNMFIDDLLGASSADEKVELCMAIFLNSMDPREFDYLYAKYNSMHNNLKEIYGIGQEVATELLKDKNCETYREAEQVLWRTNLPEMYVGDARTELKEQIEKGEDELVSSNIPVEYSDVVVSNSI